MRQIVKNAFLHRQVCSFTSIEHLLSLNLPPPCFAVLQKTRLVSPAWTLATGAGETTFLHSQRVCRLFRPLPHHLHLSVQWRALPEKHAQSVYLSAWVDVSRMRWGELRSSRSPVGVLKAPVQLRGNVLIRAEEDGLPRRGASASRPVTRF